MKQKFLPYLGYYLLKLFKITWKYKVEKLPAEIQDCIKNDKPFIFAHFHGDEISLISYFCNWPVHVMVSQSKDGAILAKILEKFGYTVIRGSTHRGGAVALVQMIRKIQKTTGPKILTLTVDGPRGPRHVVKPGVFKLAEKLNAPILPVVANCSNSWVFKKTWAQEFLPKFFAKIEIKFLPVLQIEKGYDVKKICTTLQENMINQKI